MFVEKSGNLINFRVNSNHLIKTSRFFSMFSRPIAFPCLKANTKQRREKSPEHCKLATSKRQNIMRNPNIKNTLFCGRLKSEATRNGVGRELVLFPFHFRVNSEIF